MKKILYLTISIIFIPTVLWAAWPSDSTRTKNWGSEILTDTDLEAQFDLLHQYFIDSLDLTTGHKHDATANEGPLIDLDDDAGIIGVKGVLDVDAGGTGLSTLTDGGVLLGSGTGDITPMSVLSAGGIIIGDGTTDPVTLGAFTGTLGTLKHEYGGVELDISSIGTGDVIAGKSSGVVEVVDGGSASTGDVLTVSSSGTLAFDTPGVKLHAKKTVTTLANSGDITLEASKMYLVRFEFVQNTSTGSLFLRFNSDSSSSSYAYVGRSTHLHGTETPAEAGNSGTTQIDMSGPAAAAATQAISGQFWIDTTLKNGDGAFVIGGELLSHDGTRYVQNSFTGVWLDNTSVTDFEILTSVGSLTGNIYVYEHSLTVP